MMFRHPSWLGLVALAVFALVLLEARLARRRRREWSALGVSRRLPRSGGFAWIAALALLGVALAGPLGRQQPSLTAAAAGPDVVLLVDVSRSMAAEDAVPNRMGLAVRAAERIVEQIGRQAAGRVGVVAFAGRGVPRCPLTENLGAAFDVLHALRPGDIQPGGSDLGAAFRAALDEFDSESNGGRVIVALTDGEDHGGSWRDAIAEAERAGVVIDAVAIGDAEKGHPVPVLNAAGERSELTFEGTPVRTRRDDSALLEAARATGGVLIKLGLNPPDDLPALVEPSLVNRLPKSESGSRERVERDERFGWFVAAALVVGLIGSGPGRGPRALVLIAATACVSGPGWAGPEATSHPAVVSRDRPSSAELDRWLNVIAEHPTAAVPNFNAAAALFQLGRYQEALKHYAAARDHADARLRATIDFALGNTAFALGDHAGALRHYDDCLASKVIGAGAAALRRDAAINRKFVERHIPPQSQRPEDRDTGGAGESQPPPKLEPKPPAVPPEPKPNPAPSASGPTDQPPEQPPQPEASPSDQLDAALNHARDARRFRLPDEPPPAPRAPNRRDW